MPDWDPRDRFNLSKSMRGQCTCLAYGETVCARLRGEAAGFLLNICSNGGRRGIVTPVAAVAETTAAARGAECRRAAPGFAKPRRFAMDAHYRRGNREHLQPVAGRSPCSAANRKQPVADVAKSIRRCKVTYAIEENHWYAPGRNTRLDFNVRRRHCRSGRRAVTEVRLVSSGSPSKRPAFALKIADS